MVIVSASPGINIAPQGAEHHNIFVGVHAAARADIAQNNDTVLCLYACPIVQRPPVKLSAVLVLLKVQMVLYSKPKIFLFIFSHKA